MTKYLVKAPPPSPPSVSAPSLLKKRLALSSFQWCNSSPLLSRAFSLRIFIRKVWAILFILEGAWSNLLTPICALVEGAGFKLESICFKRALGQLQYLKKCIFPHLEYIRIQQLNRTFIKNFNAFQILPIAITPSIQI